MNDEVSQSGHDWLKMHSQSPTGDSPGSFSLRKSVSDDVRGKNKSSGDGFSLALNRVSSVYTNPGKGEESKRSYSQIEDMTETQEIVSS